MSAMHNPVAFSPNERHARLIAAHFARLFPTGSTVVDIGFGQGFFMEEGKKAGLEVIGIDRDAELVEQAAARGLRVLHADVRDLKSLIPDTVHGVIGSHIIEHLTPDDVGALLRDAASITAPGGSAIFVTPNPRDFRVISDLFWWDPTHVRPYTAAALQQIVDPADWVWDTQGYEPTMFTRETPKLWLQRLRYGRDYGRGSSWFKFRRAS